MSTAVELPPGLVDTLPPGKYDKGCEDGDFACGHWAHGTPQDGLYVLSDVLSGFFASKATE